MDSGKEKERGKERMEETRGPTAGFSKSAHLKHPPVVRHDLPLHNYRLQWSVRQALFHKGEDSVSSESYPCNLSKELPIPEMEGPPKTSVSAICWRGGGLGQQMFIV